jgi:anti-sigma B factor antagonist
MTARDLSFSKREKGTAVTVSVAGELDIATRLTFEAYLDEVLSAGPGEIIIDLSRLSFVDAGGLRALVALRARAERQQTPLVLTGVSVRTLRILKIAGLDGHLPIAP